MSVTLLQSKPTYSKEEGLIFGPLRDPARSCEQKYTNSQILTNPTQFENDHDSKLCDSYEADY